MIKKLLAPFIYVLLFCTSVSLPYTSNAQDPTPNAGFEDWTEVNFFGNFFTPNGWDNLDSATAIIGILTCQRTTDAHAGMYAAKLVTYEVNIFGTDTANGVMSTGNIITIPPYGIEGGIPYNERPDSIACWVKYFPQGADATQIQFNLFSNNGDTIATALLKIATTISNYTRFAAPIEYFSTATPDYSRWLLVSSFGFTPVPGSVLYIDDLSLLFTTGINEVANESGLQLINTLVTDQLLLSNPKHLSGTLKLYNDMGALAGSYVVNPSSEQIRLLPLSNGIYFCTISDEAGTVLLQKKILVQE